jgi:HAD superfamily phosphoserine phosphatase-like hydrolase
MTRTHPWLLPFSTSFRNAINAALEAAPSGSGRRIAAFDADGTLWAEDIGEAFLRWMIAAGRLPLYRGRHDLYQEYEERVRQDRSSGYAWAVQVMAGNREGDLLEWSGWLATAWPTYRPTMKGLLEGLSQEGVEVWIVSASNRWTIRAAAPFVGVDPEKTMGIAVKTDHGVLTDQVERPIICMEGKVEAIRQRFGTDPLLAAGDSLGDLAMLESARFPLVVGRRDQPRAALLSVAAGQGWPVHLF